MTPKAGWVRASGKSGQENPFPVSPLQAKDGTSSFVFLGTVTGNLGSEVECWSCKLQRNPQALDHVSCRSTPSGTQDEQLTRPGARLLPLQGHQHLLFQSAHPASQEAGYLFYPLGHTPVSTDSSSSSRLVSPLPPHSQFCKAFRCRAGAIRQVSHASTMVERRDRSSQRAIPGSHPLD